MKRQVFNSLRWPIYISNLVDITKLLGNKSIEFFFQVYRKCYGQHVGFSMFMDNILLSLARKVNTVNKIYNIDLTALLENISLNNWTRIQDYVTNMYFLFTLVTWT